MRSEVFKSETGNESKRPHKETFDALFTHHSEATEEVSSYLFPAAIDGICDLDAYVVQHPIEQSADTVPQWAQHLTQAEATRFLQVCDGSTKRNAPFESFLKSTTYFSSHATEYNRVLRLLACQDIEQTRNVLREWLKRHGLEGFTEEAGVFIQKPGFLRSQEQDQLIIPNLRQILKQHFADHPTPSAQRTIMDIGTWDGRIPNSLKDIFAKIIAVEPSEERFGQLALHTSHQFECVNAGMQDLLEYPEVYPFTPDAMNMSHVHYFLSRDGSDFRSLDWALARLQPGGIGLVTLNDMTRIPGSRADLRHHFGVSEKGPNPEEYARHLKRQNTAVRVMHPTLHFRASTSDGYQAMRDVMRFMLPGEARHDHRTIDAYLEGIRKADGIFRHRLFMMAFYKVGACIPEERDDGQEEFFPGTRKGRRQQVLAYIRDESDTLPPLDLNTFERIESFSQLSPQALLDLLTSIAEATKNGLYDGVLTQILEHMGISRVVYFEWLGNERAIQEAAQRGDTGLPFFKNLSSRLRSKPRMTKADRMREIHMRILNRVRDVFPQGLPSSLALRSIGMGHMNNGSTRSSEQQWYDLAQSAHEHRSELLDRLEKTHVDSIRSLIGALLSLGDIV